MAAGDVEDVEGVDVDDDIVHDLDAEKPSGAELRRLRKQRLENREAKRLERFAKRVQARRSDAVVQVVSKPSPSPASDQADSLPGGSPDDGSVAGASPAEGKQAAEAAEAAPASKVAAVAPATEPKVAAAKVAAPKAASVAAPKAASARAVVSTENGKAQRRAAAPAAAPAADPKAARAARRARAEARAAARLAARVEARKARKAREARARQRRTASEAGASASAEKADAAANAEAAPDPSPAASPDPEDDKETPEERAARREAKKEKLKAKLERHKKRQAEKEAKAEEKRKKRAADEADGKVSVKSVKKSKVLKWEVRQTALVRVEGGPSLPAPLFAAAEAAAALTGKNVLRMSSSSSSSSEDGDEKEAGKEDDDQDFCSDSEGSASSSSMSSLSSSISDMSEASSASSGAMAIAKELAEGAVASFSWERPVELKPIAEMSLQPTSAPAGMPVKGKASAEVETFIMACQVDAESGARLRALPPALQRVVMDQGAIIGCRNPSSVLSSRIRDAEMGRLAPGNPGSSNAVTGITPQMLLPCKDKEVEACIAKYKLDMRAAGMIRALPHDERRRILDIPLAEARNPSAFIIQQLSNGGRLSANSTVNNLDVAEKTMFGSKRGQYIPKPDGML
eukprot:TRINITY_DN6714_c0_g1_i1.p1 TRINITY_DN6714_c0_g1~~TRINITY_DN6714_c0_g1_i1.p1  ORF type:complete len:630 (-),score=188.92 TRINITY_DN6714_c0_g1_i1:77-1966(-)